MMHDTLTRVLVERERLRARIDGQRGELERRMAGLAGPFAVIDRVRAGLRVLRSHPALVVAGLGAVLALRARSVLRLVARGATLWRLGVSARRIVRELGY